ncbi:hypothetical protein K440DRAFT_583831, partial [Wilcoxina mikolae CBS 423.85]
MTTTTGSLRPLLQSLKPRLLRPPPSRTATNYATLQSLLPRKIGMHGQPKVFHSPQTSVPRRRIRIHPPIAAPPTTNAVDAFTTLQLSVLDPTGSRAHLFSRHNRDALRVGDVIQVRRKNGEPPFAGVLINIRRRGVDSGILLRGQITRVGVEVWFKVFSPNVEGIDLIQRREKRAKRAKLYYMRQPQHDMGSVQNIVAQYTRQRAMLRGDGKRDGAGGQHQGK